MINSQAGTDYQTRIALPRVITRPLIQELVPGTITGWDTTLYITTINVYRLIESALSKLDKLQASEIISEGRNLLTTLVETIRRTNTPYYDSINLPELQVLINEDGSLVIEWPFDDFRVGFTIEKNKDESGWYLVTTKKLGFINASGYFLDIDRRKLLDWLVNFVTTNY